MRVLHVTPSFARRDGGPSETLRGLIPELRAAGVDVHTLSTDKGLGAADHDFIAAGGVTIVKSRPPRSWNFAPGMLRPLWRLVGEVDAVHIHSVNTFTTTIAMIIARLRKTPYVLEPHGALDSYHMGEGRRKKSLYNRVIDRWGFAGLGGVLTSSSHERVDSQKLLVAPHFDMPLGVDERLFGLARESKTRAQILFLGRIAKKKRLDLVLGALADPRLAAARFELVVAGPVGDDLDYVPSELASRLGVADRVSFLGPVDNHRRAELLASSGVFVLPSEDESFGVAVAEAMAAGCAVIASEQVGIAPDAAKAGALVLSSLDSYDLATQLACMVSQPALIDEIGGRARAFAEGRFRWAASASAAKRAYESICEK